MLQAEDSKEVQREDSFVLLDQQSPEYLWTGILKMQSFGEDGKDLLCGLDVEQD